MPRPRRPLAIAWIHLAVLWALGFAQPLFDVLADEPAFFVARGNPRVDILLLAFGLTLVPPSLLVVTELLSARAEVDRSVAHLLFVAGLTAALALQLLELTGLPSRASIPLALAAGTMTALAYQAGRLVPRILSALTPVPALFLALFLLVSPVSKLVLPRSEATAATRGFDHPAPVVYVVFDELAGHMLMDGRERVDASRFPNFAALARDSTWYRNATTVADQTTQAVPAMLSGRRPRRGELPIASDHPDNLFTLLGKAYSLHVVEAATDLCPDRLCGRPGRKPLGGRLRGLLSDLSVVSLHRLLPDDLDAELPAVDRTFEAFGGDEQHAERSPFTPGDIPAEAFADRASTFESFTRGIEPDPYATRPSLHFLHVALPHIPWQYLPSGQQYPVGGEDVPGLTDERWSDDPYFAEQGLQRHLLQLGYTDRLLGRLLQRLRKTGLYERSLIIVTADHGASFRPGRRRRRVTSDNVADIAGIPLFVKSPDQRRGRVEDSPVTTLDLLPLIADELRASPGPARTGPVRTGRETPALHPLRSFVPGGRDGSPSPAPGPPTLAPLPSLSSARRDRGMPEPARQPVADRERVAVSSGTGATVRVHPGELKRRRRAELRRRIRLFGAKDGWRRVYEGGTPRALTGKSLAQLRLAGSGDGQVTLDAAGSLDALDPRAGLVPAFLTGRLEGVRAGRPDVVVAVNGRVRAVARTFDDGSGQRFAAVIAPERLRRGTNAVELFTMRPGPDGRPLLAPLDQKRARLARQAGHPVIVGSPGRELPIVPGAVDGFVDRVRPAGRDVLLVKGWAGDTRSRRPADRILVFAGDRLLGSERPRVVREDLADRFGGPPPRAGFDIRVPAKGATEPGEITVFGVVRGRASELPRVGAP